VGSASVSGLRAAVGEVESVQSEPHGGIVCVCVCVCVCVFRLECLRDVSEIVICRMDVCIVVMCSSIQSGESTGDSI
jgi:hypothetical protein